MKSVIFNERYGMETATLTGIKQRDTRYEKCCGFILDGLRLGLTRVVFEHNEIRTYSANNSYIVHKTKYVPNDIVAIKQSYQTVWRNMPSRIQRPIFKKKYENTPGWTNKQLVKASEMPHQIKILTVDICRLNDISDKESIAEGIEYVGDEYADGVNDYFYRYYNYKLKFEHQHQKIGYFSKARYAFASLFSKLTYKNMWRINPYVIVYTFELIK